MKKRLTELVLEDARTDVSERGTDTRADHRVRPIPRSESDKVRRQRWADENRPVKG
jgi:hypothetical protein